MAVKMKDIYRWDTDSVYFTNNSNNDILLIKKGLVKNLKKGEESFAVISGYAKYLFSEMDGSMSVDETIKYVIKHRKIPKNKHEEFVKKSIIFLKKLISLKILIKVK